MAEITAQMVKALREKTGAGMMDCKKALEAAGGDMERAIDELRKRGQAIADKKGARATREGLIFAGVEDGVGVLLEVNCETDFVARNEAFVQFGRALTRLAREAAPASVAALMELPLEGRPAAEALRDLIARIGENMAVSRFVRFDARGGPGAGFLQAYIHPPGKLGVLIELRAGKPETLRAEPFVQLARDLAMQVAAAQPLAIDRASVPADVVARERAIYADQVKMEGKPEKIRDKIVDGKMAKFYQQACLLEQPFVRDADQTVQGLIEAVSRQVGDTITVARFERMVVGGAAEGA